MLDAFINALVCPCIHPRRRLRHETCTHPGGRSYRPALCAVPAETGLGQPDRRGGGQGEPGAGGRRPFPHHHPEPGSPQGRLGVHRRPEAGPGHEPAPGGVPQPDRHGLPQGRRQPDVPGLRRRPDPGHGAPAQGGRAHLAVRAGPGPGHRPHVRRQDHQRHPRRGGEGGVVPLHLRGPSPPPRPTPTPGATSCPGPPRR